MSGRHGTESEVFQLVYISAATGRFDADTLYELLRKSRVKNKALGITGMLVYHEGSFIQAIEGDEERVLALYEQIAGDPRHAQVSVLFRGHVAERSFADWSMGFYFSDPSEPDYPGFRQQLPAGFRDEVEHDPGMARQALEAFRAGQWRQLVES